jgi:glutamin-(asparagin-)ase
LHLTVPSAKPIVLTGAMRPGTALAADGPANLLHAVAVAAHPGSAGRGVLVVMNEEIHSARDVAKVHSLRLDAFASQHGAGPGGGGRAALVPARGAPHGAASGFDIARIDALPLVGVVASHGNMRREIYDSWAALGARAIVHAGFGGGTVPDYLKAPLAELRARRAAGALLAHGRGAGGARRQHRRRRAGLGGGGRPEPAARALAALALTRGGDPDAVQQVFLRY